MSSDAMNGKAGKKGNKRKRSEMKKSDDETSAVLKAEAQQLDAAVDKKQSKEDKKKKKSKKTKKEKKKAKKEEQVEDAAAKTEENGKKKREREEKEEEKDDKKKKDKKKKKKEKKTDKKEREETKQQENGTNGHAQEVQVVSEAESNKFREEHNITVSGDGSDALFTRPILTFEQAEGAMAQRVRDESLVAGGEEAVRKLTSSFFASTRNFTRPTPIQSQCWPILLAKRDVVGIAETGSGKTLAFLLPSLLHIKKTQQNSQPSQKGRKEASPIVLVLSPTRELAMQTADVARELGGACNAKSICIYGGVSKDEQVRELRGGVQIVVATPGRLLDLVKDGALTLANVDYLVLDEADRMLDLGFEEDIRAIIKQVRQQRQTLMFSATWPQIIQKLASEFLSSPIKVAIGSQDLQACKRVKQVVEVMDNPHARDNRLDQLLRQYQKNKGTKIIIFVLYKKEAVRVESMLLRRGWTGIQAIHGDKHQNDRTNSLNNFKSGRSPILIATDVAARGLDIPDVEYVINYSFPLTIEDYVHRIGRTGRAGKEGLAHTLFTDFDKARAGELVNVLREAGQEVPEKLTRFGTHVKKKEHKLYGAHFKEVGSDSGAPAAPKRITFD